MSYFRLILQRALPLTALAMSALLAGGCATIFVSSNDRVNRCVQLERQQYGVGSPGTGKKHSDAELQSACGKWEGRKQLSDDGKWTGGK